MNKTTIFSITFLVIGLVCEVLYLWSNNALFDAKFAFVGTICIVVGLLSLWLFSILPNKEDEGN